MLRSLREIANRSQLQKLQVRPVLPSPKASARSRTHPLLWSRPQLSGAEAAPGPGEVLALQASLFQAQLELQAGQRAQRQAARAQEDQNRALERLKRDLQGALQHRRETERHNQVKNGRVRGNGGSFSFSRCFTSFCVAFRSCSWLCRRRAPPCRRRRSS